jgi:hypothetical protein
MTWAQAFRDIVVTSMNRGQLPVLGLIGIVVLLLWKMPESDVSKLVFDIFQELKNGQLLAYPLWLITVAGWFYHAKSMRQMFSDEAARIGREKSQPQSKISNTKFKSSDKK